MSIDNLSKQPHSVRHSRRGQQQGYKAKIKIDKPAKLSEIMAMLTGRQEIKDDPTLQPGTYNIRAVLDINETA